MDLLLPIIVGICLILFVIKFMIKGAVTFIKVLIVIGVLTYLFGKIVLHL